MRRMRRLGGAALVSLAIHAGLLCLLWAVDPVEQPTRRTITSRPLAVDIVMTPSVPRQPVPSPSPGGQAPTKTPSVSARPRSSTGSDAPAPDDSDVPTGRATPDGLAVAPPSDAPSENSASPMASSTRPSAGSVRRSKRGSKMRPCSPAPDCCTRPALRGRTTPAALAPRAIQAAPARPRRRPWKKTSSSSRSARAMSPWSVRASSRRPGGSSSIWRQGVARSSS